MLKTTHTKTPRNTQNNNASRAHHGRRNSTHPHLALQLPSATWQQLATYNSSGSHLGLSPSPLFHFPLSFSVSCALFHPVLSLAFSPPLISYLLSILFLLPTEGRVLCTPPQANFNYFQGEMSYLCVVFISSYVACLQLCYSCLLCSYFVVVNDKLIAILSSVHLTSFSVSSVPFIA